MNKKTFFREKFLFFAKSTEIQHFDTYLCSATLFWKFENVLHKMVNQFTRIVQSIFHITILCTLMYHFCTIVNCITKNGKSMYQIYTIEFSIVQIWYIVDFYIKNLFFNNKKSASGHL